MLSATFRRAARIAAIGSALALALGAVLGVVAQEPALDDLGVVPLDGMPLDGMPLDAPSRAPPLGATRPIDANGANTHTGAVDQQIAEAQQTLVEQRAQLTAIQRARATLPEAERELTDALSRDVRALYRLRRGGLLPLAGGLPALVSHASRVAHLERMARRTLSKLEDTRRRDAALAKEAAEVDAKVVAMERDALSLESKRASLAAEAAAAAALAAQQTQQAELAVRAESATDSARVSYGLTLVGGSERSRDSFAAQRGLLALPVTGATSIAPTEPMTEGRRKGLQFEARPGASVRAAAAGTVSAIERGDDGVVVVLDHGQRYQTIYGGLASSDLEPGDAVSKSARVGSAGSVPVRFEVRRGSRNQDARSFLGL